MSPKFPKAGGGSLGPTPRSFRKVELMARKVINRKELRAQNEAAEAAGKGEKGEAAAKPAKKEPAKRKSRAKAPVEIRRKLFWGVFNQSMKRVALYDFTQKKQADQKAEDLSSGGKAPHFVQKVKEEVKDEPA
jgi:hypothetical protein